VISSRMSELEALIKAAEKKIVPTAIGGATHTDPNPMIYDSPMLLPTNGNNGYRSKFVSYWIWIICGRIFAEPIDFGFVAALRSGESPVIDVDGRVFAAYHRLIDKVRKAIEPHSILDGGTLPSPVDVVAAPAVAPTEG
jgi:hypothetical protein